MQWNEVDYDMQNIVLAKIAALVKKEKEEDSVIRFALVAALNELDLWGNRPDIPDVDPPPMTEFDYSITTNYNSSPVQAIDSPCDAE